MVLFFFFLFLSAAESNLIISSKDNPSSGALYNIFCSVLVYFIPFILILILTSYSPGDKSCNSLIMQANLFSFL